MTRHPVEFTKMSGSGNDFIIIDNRRLQIDPTDARLPEWIAAVCRRKLSVGADGLMLIENDEQVDFKWHFFNADGTRAEMCGNGARCAAAFAHHNAIADTQMRFRTDAGIIEAWVSDSRRIKLKMTPPHDLVTDIDISDTTHHTLTVHHINTGVPHIVAPCADIQTVDVVNRGRHLRRHTHFAPQGVNVNFVETLGKQRLAVRTYERGVEDETLACGTGAVASALITARLNRMDSPIAVLTRSGSELDIYFDHTDAGFSEVYLEGDARRIYTGCLQPDAWQ